MKVIGYFYFYVTEIIHFGTDRNAEMEVIY